MMKWSSLTTEERDRLVHTKVMDGSIDKCGGIAYYTGRIGEDEWYCETCKKYYYDIDDSGKHDTPIPHYSTDMNAAWQIVESHKFMEVKLEYSEGWRSEMERWQSYLCTISPYNGALVSANGNTMPEALCFASLLACFVEIEP